MADEYVAIKLIANGEVSKITDARIGDFPKQRKHKPAVHKGEIIEVPENLAEEAIAGGRWVKIEKQHKIEAKSSKPKKQEKQKDEI